MFLLPLPGQSYSGVWKELPKDWLEGLNVAKQVRFLYYGTLIQGITVFKIFIGEVYDQIYGRKFIFTVTGERSCKT